MEDGAIVRLWTTFFCFTILGIALNWCLMPAVSFADVSPQENYPVVSPPVIDTVRKADAKSEKFTHSSRSLVGKDACFWTEDRPKNRLGPLGFDGNHNLLLPLTTICVGLLASVDDIGWPGYEARGDHARSVENWPEAEQAYAMAVGLLDRTDDKEVNQDLAALLNKLGITRFKQQDFAGSETVFRRALTIYTLTWGSEDLRVADTLDLVASALFEQQQGRALAGPLFYRAWMIRGERLRPDHPAVADSLHHVAVSLYYDNLSLAIPLFLRSLEIREKVFGHNHPLVANSLNAMARLYELHDRRDLAIPLYQDALTIQEKVFGPNASETRQVRSSLDMAHQWMDHLQEDPNGRD
jgi:tetratricopeptide (TPR) repeat protein